MALDIEAIIADARTYASDVFDEALDLLGDAVTASRGYATLYQKSLNFTASVKDDISFTPVRDFTDAYYSPTNNAEFPTFVDLYVPQIPDDWGTKPDALDTSGLFDQDVPVWDIQPFTEAAPDVNVDLTVPDAPDLNFSDKPILDTIIIDPAPEVTIPTFDEDFLLGDPEKLEGVVERFESEYSQMLPQMKAYIDDSVVEWIDKYSPEYHNGLAQLEAKIAAGMPGGQALSDEVEQSIYDKARARVQAERINQERSLLTDMAKRGFDLPPGAVAGGLQQIAADSARNNAMSATETAIERAKMEIQHVQFVMQQANYLRQFMQNLAMQRAQQMGQVNGQAMEYAGKIADIMINVYEAYLKQYSAAIEIYKTQASVYEVRIKSAMAELEAYKIEMEGKRLQGDLQKLQVEVYATEINAEKAKIDLFLGELQGVATQAQLEKTKVEIFGEQVNAYLGTVKAKSAEYEAYKAAISGDSAKVDAYVAQVNAYRSEVEASKAELSGEVAVSESRAQHNKNLTEQYKAELLSYTTEIEAEKTRFAASSDAYKTGLEAYKTELTAQLEVLKSKLMEDELDLKAAVANFEGNIKLAVENANLFMKHVDILSSTTAQSSQIAANIAAAALDSQNTMVQAQQV